MSTLPYSPPHFFRTLRVNAPSRLSTFTAALTLVVLVGLGSASSSQAQIIFNDAATAAGIGADFYSGVSNHGGGVNWLDYDNDGWADLFFVNGKGFACNLYRNEGDGSFSNQSALLPVIDNALELTHSAYADYDNDGDVDLYVGVTRTVMAADGPANMLLKNLWVENGGTTVPGQPLFVDVAAAAGVQNLANPPLGTMPGYPTLTLGWVDYDRDGCLDLYVASMAAFLSGTASNTNTLYHNNCDGTFEDVSVAAGLTSGGVGWLRPTLAFGAALINDDMWPDLYVINVADPSPNHFDFFFMNNGDGTFTEVSGTMPGIGNDSGAGMGIDFADIDLDGDWDMYMSDLVNPGNEPLAEGNVLYLGNPDGTWSDNSAPAAGVASNGGATGSWGVSFFDADQDGYEDLFVGVIGDHDFFRNNHDGTFSDISISAGMSTGSGRGSAYADYDHDGDLDLGVMNMHGFVNLYENVSTGLGNQIQFRLDATTSNRSAIGTLVEITAGDQNQMRQMKGVVSAHSQDEALLHFGLGARRVVDEIQISWPSGIVQRLYNIPADQVVTIRETSGSFLQSSGRVIVEAEHFDNKTVYNAQGWSATTDFAGFSGDAAMQVGPDIGTRISIPRRGNPDMAFAVDFTETGTFYVWARVWAPNADARKLHIGLDGAFSISQAARMNAGATGSWVWTNTGAGSSRAVLDVATTGVHMVNVGMSDDGIVVDKVVLTASPTYTPANFGPAESPRAGGDTIVAEAPINASVETVPTAYGLAPSYPNPFTGATTIPFATPADGAVNLAVYDLLGRRVATLVDEVVAAGSHQVNWTATELPSGVYFVRLTAGSFVATQRVTLMR